MKTYQLLTSGTGLILLSVSTLANSRADLDDIRQWPLVKMETCLDAALDTIPGKARKLELKLEGDDAIYEFDIEADADGNTYNVECNAEEGFVTEIEMEVSADNPVFRKLAKFTYEQAKDIALMFHPGEVVASEREIGQDGNATYEFDIESIHGYEIKVDIDATSGEIEEANIELYEIGSEK